LDGVLVAQQGCLAVESEGWGGTLLLVLPDDEVEPMEDGGVLLFGEERHLGQRVAFGGGGREGVPGSSVTIPDGCDVQNTTEWFLGWTDA